MGRALVVAGGVLAGFLVVLMVSGSGDFWSEVRELAAEREVELRDALGLNEEVA